LNFRTIINFYDAVITEENEIDSKKKSTGSVSDEERGSSMNGHRHRCHIVNCEKVRVLN